MIRTGRKTAFFFAMLFLFFATPEVSSSLSRTDKREILSFISSSSKKNGTLGIVVRAADTGETVFRYNSEKSFIPASNNKILSSVAALSLLGKDFRFRTEFYLGGGIHGNVAHGGLYVKGFGDPTIDLEKLELIAKRIKNLGVNRIDGGILLDGSYFDETYYGEGWDPEWVGEAFCPPVAAISFNYNSAKIKVSASRAGMPAYVSAEPKEFPFAIKSRVLTSRRRSGVMAEFGSRNQIRLSGYVSSRRKRETLEMSVPDPFFYFGEMLRATLEKKGVRVDGRVRRARVPKWAGAVFTHYSEPLGVVIREYNKESVNIIGESLVKVLGARFMKEPGSWKTGTYVIRDYLAGVGSVGGRFRRGRFRTFENEQGISRGPGRSAPQGVQEPRDFKRVSRIPAGRRSGRNSREKILRAQGEGLREDGISGRSPLPFGLRLRQGRPHLCFLHNIERNGGQGEKAPEPASSGACQLTESL